MRLAEAVGMFLLTCRADGLTSRTVVTYEQRLTRLVNRLGKSELPDVTIQALRDYVAALYDEDLSIYTVHGHVRTMKRLYNWLQAEGDIQSNTAASIRLPRLPSAPPKAISFQDAQRMLKAAATIGEEWERRRNLAMLLFLADTGCRLQGLMSLRLSDLDLECRTAKVTEKNSQWRFVFLKPVTVEALSVWLCARSEVALDQAGDAVWVARHGGPFARWGFQSMISRLKKRGGVVGPAGAHSFRHFFAINYILSGGDLATLADLLGHTDIETTKMYYARFKLAELQKKHDLHSPIPSLLGEVDGATGSYLFESEEWHAQV